jgi:vacuolar-type H+-ATPase subunit I/STV1
MINISNFSLKFNDLYQARTPLSDEKSINKASDADTTEVKQQQGISVNLSADSKDKLAQEASDKLKATRPAQKSDDDPIDSLIEQLQDQIKALKDKLRDIRYDSSEAAETNRKMLNAQLISLHSLLLSTMGKKIEAATS